MQDNQELQLAYFRFRRKNLEAPNSIKELELLLKEAKIKKSTPFTLFFEALILVENHQLKIAKEKLEKATDLWHEFYSAHNLMIYCLAHLNMIEKALKLNLKLVEKLRNSRQSDAKVLLAEALSNLAVLYHYENNQDDCIKCNQEILALQQVEGVNILEDTLMRVKFNMAMLTRLSAQKNALNLIDECLDSNPKHVRALIVKAWLLRSLARKDDRYQEEARFATDIVAKTVGREDKPEIQLYLDFLLEEYSEQELRKTFFDISYEEKRLNQFLKDKPSFNERESFLLILREWNSYTPMVPRDMDPGRGGGYFIFHNGQGVVIDPGYDFIRNFGEAGGGIRDIHHIIITHAHNDHTADFESILSLLHNFNKLNGIHKKNKRVKLYLSQGALRKLAGMIPLRGSNYIEELMVLNRGRTRRPQVLEIMRGLTLTVLPAYHDDVLTRDNAVGLGFVIQNGRKKEKLVITSDTGLFPKLLDDEGKPIAFKRYKNVYQVIEEEDKAIYNQYPISFKKPNLLIVHIGSVKSYELVWSDSIPMPRFYPDHLGILGTIKLIDNIDPQIAVITEFGEELKTMRKKLVSHISNSLKNKRKVSGILKAPFICPGDRNFVYYFNHGCPLCHTSCEPEQVENVEFTEFQHKDSSSKQVYIYRKNEEPGDLYDKIANYHEKLLNKELIHLYAIP